MSDKSGNKRGLAVMALLGAMLALGPVWPVFSQSPISIIERNPILVFGRIALMSPESAVIVLHPNREITGSNIASSGPTEPAHYLILGEAGEPLTITLTPTLSMRGVGETADAITLTALSHNLGPSPSLDENGRLHLRIGGTLTVPANIQGGTYRGGFQLTVHYN